MLSNVERAAQTMAINGRSCDGRNDDMTHVDDGNGKQS